MYQCTVVSLVLLIHESEPAGRGDTSAHTTGCCLTQYLERGHRSALVFPPWASVSSSYKRRCCLGVALWPRPSCPAAMRDPGAVWRPPRPPSTRGPPPRAEHGPGGGLGRLSIGGGAAARGWAAGLWCPVAGRPRQGGVTQAAGPPGWCGAPRPHPAFSTTRADSARGGAARAACPARRLPPAWSGSGLRLVVQTNERDTR